MKRLMMAALVMAPVGLAGCETPQPAHRSSLMDREYANDAFKKCIYANARKLDDHTSNAMVIATGAATQCGQQWHDYVGVWDEGLSPYAKLVFLDALSRSDTETAQATAIVLAERRGRPE